MLWAFINQSDMELGEEATHNRCLCDGIANNLGDTEHRIHIIVLYGRLWPRAELTLAELYDRYQLDLTCFL
jgi:hypothetical protein